MTKTALNLNGIHPQDYDASLYIYKRGSGEAFINGFINLSGITVSSGTIVMYINNSTLIRTGTTNAGYAIFAEYNRTSISSELPCFNMGQLNVLSDGRIEVRTYVSSIANGYLAIGFPGSYIPAQ